MSKILFIGGNGIYLPKLNESSHIAMVRAENITAVLSEQMYILGRTFKETVPLIDDFYSSNLLYDLFVKHIKTENLKKHQRIRFVKHKRRVRKA